MNDDEYERREVHTVVQMLTAVIHTLPTPIVKTLLSLLDVSLHATHPFTRLPLLSFPGVFE